MKWLLRIGLGIFRMIRGNGVASMAEYKKKEVIPELILYDYLMFISQFPYLYLVVIPCVTFPLATIVVAIVCLASLLSVMMNGYKSFGNN